MSDRKQRLEAVEEIFRLSKSLNRPASKQDFCAAQTKFTLRHVEDVCGNWKRAMNMVEARYSKEFDAWESPREKEEPKRAEPKMRFLRKN